MDPITQQTVLAAAGAGGDKVYVDDVFSTYPYLGNTSTQTINNGIDLSGEGGLVWIKNRTSSVQNVLIDTEQGANKYMTTQDMLAPVNNTNLLKNFNSNGFGLGPDEKCNRTNDTYVSWSFRKQKGFCDVVTYTGTGSTQSIPHNLGSVPGMMIIKTTNNNGHWVVYHRSLGASKMAHLGYSDLAYTNTTYWDTPTDSVFTVKTHGYVNQVNDTFVAYLFAHDDASFGTGGDESIIKCGTYGLTSGFSNQTIDLGFEPQFILFKRTDTTGNWNLVDNMRGLNDVSMRRLRANADAAEQTVSPGKIVPNATGFTAIEGSSDYLVGPSSSYIYMAIRRPNKPPEAATDVFAIDYGHSIAKGPSWDSGFPVDLAFSRSYAGSGDNKWATRLQDNKFLRTDTAIAEATESNFLWDHADGWAIYEGANMISYMFKRAPGFVDVVAYSGTGSIRTISHNLEAVPELIIVKVRNASDQWCVWQPDVFASNNTYKLRFDTDDAAAGSASIFNSTAPTDSVFTVGTSSRSNNSGNPYIAYLFATLPGISKLGSYNGTGNAINVDCGFTSGARFILIKRWDSTGDWYVWDTLRGIVSGNDPYLVFNTNAATVTNTDYIDPLSSGFTVTSSAPAALNTSGGKYFFLAIA